MTDTIHLRSTSSQSAIIDDVVLKETSTTRLIFRPMMVENPNNAKHSIKGSLIHQRRAKMDQWEDLTEATLAKLKSGEGVRLNLSSEETKKLYDALTNQYALFQKLGGVPLGEREFTVTTGNLSGVLRQILKEPKLLTLLMTQGGAPFFSSLVAWLGRTQDIERIVNQLVTLPAESISQIGLLAGYASLVHTLKTWNSNKCNDKEEFWQKTLAESSWILAQIFACPAILMGQKVYVGGKVLSNKGGSIADFLYKNHLTNNAALIEIKTPCTPLLGGAYRDGVYSPSSELSGAITQVLNCRHRLLQNIHSIMEPSVTKVEVVSPKCVVLAGTVEQMQGSDDKVKSFELWRSAFKDVDILTYDELFGRIAGIADLLRKDTVPQAQGETASCTP